MEPSQIILKITLRSIRPPIWRRVRVSSEMSLRMLHQVIQAAMGWEDTHLYEFRIGDRLYGEALPDAGWPDARRIYSDNAVKLGSFVDQRIRRFQYIYDFGDDWEHEVVIEKVEPVDPEQQYPSLITGKRRCPPEDCGGGYGYVRLLEVLADPTAEEHAELTEWVGGEFDPEHLEPQAINQKLAGIARRGRQARRSRRGSR